LKDEDDTNSLSHNTVYVDLTTYYNIKLSIKIAYVIDTITSDKAGTEKQLLEIIRRLDRRIFEPCVIFLYSSPWIEQNDLPCERHVLGYEGLINLKLVGVIKKLKGLIEDKQIDIVQTFFLDSIFVGFLVAIVCKFHTIFLSSRRDMGLGEDDLWYHKLYKSFLPFVSRGFNGIVTNSSMVKEHVVKYEKVPKWKIKVIHNGITPPNEMYEVPELFKQTEAQLWIGIAANLKPVKRLDIFLKALALLKERCSVNFHAVILGDGPEKASLRELSFNLGISELVHFAGSVNNVYAYLKHLDIGVLCSEREGLSNALMEYMACGLPIVATAVGGNVELIDEKNGMLVPSNDVEAITSALLMLIESPKLRKDLGSVSLTRIKENYNWDKIMEAWENYYHSISVDLVRN